MDVLIYFSFMTAVVAGKQHTNQTDIDASRNGSTGIITSPGYPGNYPNNVAYTWTLKTGNLNATVSFNFQDFDIIKYRYTPHCEDYLQIYETEPCCFKAMHRCDKYKPVSLTVRGSVITITFESDNLHNSKGFHLTWTVYIPRTPAVSTTSLWTSKLQTKSSAKITVYLVTGISILQVVLTIIGVCIVKKRQTNQSHGYH
uniref:Signal peptide, CUB and EGF-like domain-containing protein 2 n=1 Tax=Magallana gigas TaxID=29159 RepID=K1QAG5_MAGGI